MDYCLLSIPLLIIILIVVVIKKNLGLIEFKSPLISAKVEFDENCDKKEEGDNEKEKPKPNIKHDNDDEGQA